MNPTAAAAAAAANGIVDCSTINSLNYLQTRPDIFEKTVANQSQTNKLSDLPVILPPVPISTQSIGNIPLAAASSSSATSTPLSSETTAHDLGSSQIAVPVAINPTRSPTSLHSTSYNVAKNQDDNRFINADDNNNNTTNGVGQLIDNDQLFQSLLANVRMLEQKICLDVLQENSNPSAFVNIRSL